MKLMPVVAFTFETPLILIDPSTNAYKKNLFVALMQESKDASGGKVADFEEFVPCSEVQD